MKLASFQNQSKPISSFLPGANNTLNDKIITAETLFSNFVAEHNLPFAISDYFTKLCKKMFTDSEIANGFACGRTKTTQIVKRAVAPDLLDDVVQKCRSQPFTIMCDKSNNYGNDKCFVILVRVFDDNLGSTQTRFLDMPIVNIGTAANLFLALDQSLTKHGIPWSNVFGFMSDNCIVFIDSIVQTLLPELILLCGYNKKQLQTSIAYKLHNMHSLYIILF